MKSFLLLIFLPSILWSYPNFADFEQYQETFTRSEIEHRLTSFLQKDEKLSCSYILTNEEFILFNVPEGKAERKIDFCLRLVAEQGEEKKQPKRENLVGVKVAIDPGHLGGAYAHLEERYIDIPPSLERKEIVRFDEGTLAFLTAKYLKLLLEKEGAEVMLTRDRIGKGVYEKDFFSWLRENPDLWWKDMSLSTLFTRLYNPIDLRARAKVINEFEPDLSVVIHYNSEDGLIGPVSNHGVVPSNYNMVFMPGAFCHNELETAESRYEFLRLLVTDDLAASHKLSSAILTQMVKHLTVPPVKGSDRAGYLKSVCLKIGEGVYSRNLALTRLIHGPVCYGESLIQNNVDECQNLNRKDFMIDGVRCSSRIREVAQSYFEGIKEYFLTD